MSERRSAEDLVNEALPAFISEAREQIETLELLLLQLEDAPSDRELLNALFRCAHTVKGSAGLFGLEQVVAFTHHMETLLDRMRDGLIVFTPALSTLLLQCNDQLRLLVDAAQDASVDAAQGEQARAALVQRLMQASGDVSEPGEGVPAAATGGGSGPVTESGPGLWHLSVYFGRDSFRSGFDPLPTLSYLSRLGEVQRVVCDDSEVPDLVTVDPENCHLGFEVALAATCTREEIEDAFSFVRDEVQLQVVEPGATIQRYLKLIDQLPDHPRLGEILVAVGAITREQLDGALSDQGGLLASQGSAPPLGEILQAQGAVPAQVVQAALSKQGKAREGAAGDDTRYIRIQADRLDAVINLLGELVIASAGASLLADESRNGQLVEANQQIGRLVEEIRNGTLQLRMVPIGETFSRFRRVVRDTAAELGKDVHLEIIGADTELDKSVVERMADPLMHLVRNGLDHGLETPEQRLAQGKPAQGCLTLRACHEAGSILIQIEDDGRGIQREKVLARAWERGLLESGFTPPDQDICQLIFEPGFSTADQVTNLSGRGVGMDVVKRSIEALRGTVTVHSTPGQGTRMDIRLPLTLAIIDGFLVGVGASRFVLPLESVVEVIEVHRHRMEMDERGRATVELRGAMLPVACLRTLYGLQGEPADRQSVVVIRHATRSFGVIVDQLLGQHQTVIKPLSRMFRSLRGMAGSSILGNGDVALIFDVNSLGDMAASEPAFRHRAAASLNA